MKCLARYKSPLTKGIKNLAFSNDGELVVASSMDDDHTIAIFKWKTQEGQKVGGALASGSGPR
jgi:WD40 repeat protein